jgi:hypothetical protein
MVSFLPPSCRYYGTSGLMFSNIELKIDRYCSLFCFVLFVVLLQDLRLLYRHRVKLLTGLNF